MKKLTCFIAAIAMLIFVFAGCSAEQNPGKPITQSDQTIEQYFAGDSDGDYYISEDAEIDLTEVIVGSDKTIFVQDATLTFKGKLSPGSGCVTVRNGGGNAALDMSELTFGSGFAPDMRLFEIHRDVVFTAPAATEGIRVEAGDEWTSISISSAENDQPGGTNMDVSTPNELIQCLSDQTVSDINLTCDLTVDFGGASLSREARINCGNYALALTGELCIHDGGMLLIDVGPAGTGTLDISGLSVKSEGIDTAGMSDVSIDLVRIQMNFKQITGEPTVAEGISYIIGDDGEHAAVCIVVGPDHGAQILEDIPLVLIGQGEGRLYGVTTELIPDGEMVVELDNPIITDEIWVDVGGGFTLKLTGSVTFDGGMYRFGFVGGTEGRATVDISELTINATDAVGETKSDNIVFWRERDGVDVLYDETNEHLSYTFGGSGNDELRFVQ